MNDTDTHAPAGWLEALAESEAELEAGLTVPMETVIKELDDSIGRLETMRKHPRERRRVAR